MCILKGVVEFFLNGIRVFRAASQGCYKEDSEIMSEIRKEVFETGGNRTDDKEKLMKDRRNVESDVRRVFNKVALNNG